MDRLTMRNSDGSVSQPLNLDWAAALERLAAYEDTGLGPEVCAEYKKFEDEIVSKGVTFKHIVDLRWLYKLLELLKSFAWAETLKTGRGKVIGEFICDTFVTDMTFGHDPMFNAAACMSEIQAAYYITDSPAFGWHISDLKIYDKPKELSEFYVLCDRCDKKAIRCEYGYEENTENGYYSECMCDFKRPIKCPPQSWCYVEEV